jgi:hypothetical protein
MTLDNVFMYGLLYPQGDINPSLSIERQADAHEFLKSLLAWLQKWSCSQLQYIHFDPVKEMFGGLVQSKGNLL